MLGARNVLKEAIPGTKVDAAVSRFPGAFIGRLKKYVARDKLADVVVLHPGTNGVLPEDMMREMLDILEDTPTVVVVNDNMPRSWRTPNNKVIDKVVPDYANAVLVDWYARVQGPPGVLRLRRHPPHREGRAGLRQADQVSRRPLTELNRLPVHFCRSAPELA